MARHCSSCGADDRLLHRCNYCGRHVCPSHVLPENHGCPALAAPDSTSTPGPGEHWDVDNWGNGAGTRNEPTRSSDLPSLVLVVLGWIIREPVTAPIRHYKITIPVFLLATGSIAFGSVRSSDYIGDAGAPIDEGLVELGDELASAVSITSNGTENRTTSEPTPRAGSPAFEEAVQQGVIEHTNNERRGRGAGPLKEDRRLSDTSRDHSLEMADRGTIYHSSNPTTCRSWGENVAKSWYRVSIIGGGYHSTPDELARGLVRQWMESAGHRENILRRDWNTIGVGIAVVEEDGNTAVYATQMFCS